jgi:hypothetical protein
VTLPYSREARQTQRVDSFRDFFGCGRNLYFRITLERAD